MFIFLLISHVETCRDLEQEGNPLVAAVFTNLTINIAKYRRCSNKVLLRGKTYRPVEKVCGIVISPKVCKVKQKTFSPLPNMMRHCLGKTLMSVDLKKANEETEV